MAQPVKKWERVACPKCEKPVPENRLDGHLWWQHGIDSERPGRPKGQDIPVYVDGRFLRNVTPRACARDC